MAKSLKNKTQRLNVFLAQAGLLARRKIEDFLKENSVEVNKQRIYQPGFRLEPLIDEVLINGKKLNLQKRFVYIMLNKPKGIISTASDEHQRKTVVDLVNSEERIYPVGRLDAETKGLILLTNDGDLANKLTHPKYHINKTYIGLVRGKVSLQTLQKLRDGIVFKEGKTKPAEVLVVEEKPNGTILKITIHEGKYHQIRKMCAQVKLELVELKRVAIGALELGDLKTGEFRDLTQNELKILKMQ